jgi:hypothetical protein
MIVLKSNLQCLNPLVSGSVEWYLHVKQMMSLQLQQISSIHQNIKEAQALLLIQNAMVELSLSQ